ncbi:MAG TPA: hypothetical protein VEV84_09935, partial [Pyrinomonadaceae bacterium]|nr:hypothetical protein [Pyrinomonadaceae bacterium]
MTEIPEQDERKNERAEIDAPGGRFVITLLATITIVSVLLFGAVDSGTLALLALLFAILIGYWGWVAFRAGRLSLNVDKIQLPLLALGVIGLIQLLPLRDNDFPAGLLSSAGLSSLSLDPYATRFFLVRLLLYIIFFATALAFINTLPRLRAVAVTLIIFGGLLAF